MKNCRISISCLIIFVFFITQSFSQKVNTYDSIFMLDDRDRVVAIQDMFYYLWDNSNDIMAFKEAIAAKGNESDKLLSETFSVHFSFKGKNQSLEEKIAIDDKYIIPAKALNNHFILALRYFSKAERYKENNLFNKSFENRLYCYDELKKDAKNNYYEQKYHLYCVGLDYYKFKDYPKALELCKIVERIKNDSIAKFSIGFYRAYFNLYGMIYLKMGQYDSAQKWLQKTYSISKAPYPNDIVWQGIAVGNLGTIHYLKNEFDKAIPLLKEGIDLCSKTNIWDNVMPFACHLSKLCINKNDLVKAEEALQIAKKALQNDKPNSVNSLLYYTTASNFYKQRKDYAMAFANVDSMLVYQKKVEGEFNIEKKLQHEGSMAYHKQELETELAKQKLRQEQLSKLFLALLIVGVIAFGIMMYRRKMLDVKQREQELHNEKLKIAEELSMAMSGIKEYTTHIKNKNQYIQEIIKEVDELKSKNIPLTPESLSAATEDFDDTIFSNDDAWDKLKNVFEKNNPHYLKRLDVKYPQINLLEKQFIILAKLKVDSDEVEEFLGITNEEIVEIKESLLKKMRAKDEESLPALIDAV